MDRNKIGQLFYRNYSTELIINENWRQGGQESPYRQLTINIFIYSGKP
jgi:hypothetical protein